MLTLFRGDIETEILDTTVSVRGTSTEITTSIAQAVETGRGSGAGLESGTTLGTTDAVAGIGTSGISGMILVSARGDDVMILLMQEEGLGGRTVARGRMLDL